MKILKNNYNAATVQQTKAKPFPRRFKCENCESELEYDKSDVVIGEYGCAFLKCPLCNYRNDLFDEDLEFRLTKDNVQFPKHFHHTSKESGAVDTCNNEYVKKCIKDGIECLRNSEEDNWTYCTGTGNTMIHIYKYDDDEDYYICVCENYYDTYIPFEPKDYR